jgi:hypothetical protein
VHPSKNHEGGPAAKAQHSTQEQRKWMKKDGLRDAEQKKMRSSHIGFFVVSSQLRAAGGQSAAAAGSWPTFGFKEVGTAWWHRGSGGTVAPLSSSDIVTVTLLINCGSTS